jgi:hypothetical protein
LDRATSHTADQPLVASVTVQALGRTRCRLALLSAAGTDVVEARFLLTGAGSVISQGVSGSGAATTYGIYALGGGRYRIWVGGKVNASETATRWTLGTVDDSSNNSYAGDITKGLYVDAAQVELNTTHPTWYIGDNATRIADVMTTSALWTLPDTLAIYFKMLRPAWAGYSGTLIGPATPAILALGNAAPRITITADSAARNLVATFTGSSGASTVAVAIPAGATIDGVALFTNLHTAPAVQLDLGSGLSAAGTGAAAATALSTTDLTIGGLKHSAGNELGSALLALKITDQALTLAQLRTRN